MSLNLCRRRITKCVCVGSGMGTQMSAELCDYAYYLLVERHFVDSLDALGIMCYLRYRADIFILAKSYEHLKRFCAIVRGNAKYFRKFTIESVSRVEVPFLDLTIFLTKHDIQWKPYRKPSHVSIYLSDESCHPRHVHSWPLCEVHRLAQIALLSSLS